MKKHTLASLIIIGTIITSYSQSGQKWATGGNTNSTGDFIGTTNNFPLDFKTNNVLRMTLGTNGVLKINNLAGIGNRLLQVDANGNIISLPQGTANQYLSGTGTWVNVPTVSSLWSSNGSNLYYNNGYIGIGTNSPLFPLDVIGDARITNNLYVGGGVVISDKVKATTEVKGWDIKVENDLSVEASTRMKGPTRIDQGFTFDGLNGIKFIPATSTKGAIYKLGGSSPVPLSIADCINRNTNATPMFLHDGAFISYVPVGSGTGSTDAALTFQTAPWDGSGLIEVSGVDNNGAQNNGLLINFFCGRNTNINTGWDINAQPEVNGGRVNMGAEVEMGRSLKIGWNGTPSVIDPNTSIEINQNKNNTSAVKVKTYAGNMKAFAVEYTDATNGFVVWGDGRVAIGDSYVPSGYRLAVKGNIIAEEVVVQLRQNWPDYVFAKEYKLKPLSEVEKYISNNKHLENIPSSKEIEANGVTLGNLVSKQMEKIEELTLYVIELKKEIDDLKKHNVK